MLQCHILLTAETTAGVTHAALCIQTDSLNLGVHTGTGSAR